MNEIIAAFNGLKVAIDIARGIKALNLDVEVKEKTIELYDALISAQEQVLNMQLKYQELENKINELNDWNEVKLQYDLLKTKRGYFVRAPNQNHPSPSPSHWICTNCFDKKKKVILQRGNPSVVDHMYCPECKTNVFLAREEKI